MELNGIQWKVLQPFVDETLKALQKSAGLKAEADSGFQDRIESFRFKGFAVVVNTRGSITGRVLIHYYTETAVAIGNKLLQQQNPSLPETHCMGDDLSNALAEFSNTIMTPAVESFRENDSKILFSQPYFISNTENIDSLLNDVQEIITVPIRVDNIGRFYINYLIHSGKKTSSE